MAYSDFEAVILLILTTILFSIYVGIRKYKTPSVDSISFTIFYVLFQFFFSFLWWLFAGVQTVSSAFAKDMWLVFFGGMVVVIAEYVCLVGIAHVKSSVYIATFSFTYVFSVSSDYIIDSSGIDTIYMIAGCSMTIAGLVCVVGAEYLQEITTLDDTDPYPSKSGDVVAKNTETTPLLNPRTPTTTASTSTSTSTSTGSEVSPTEEENMERERTATAFNSEVRFEFWIFMILCGATINSGWTIFPTIALKGSNPLTEPSLVILMFMVGQIASVPLVVFVFGYLNLAKVRDSDSTGVVSVYLRLLSNPFHEVLWCAVIAGIVWLGYVCYFYAIVYGSVPAAVAIAITSSHVPLAVCFGIVIWGEYSRVHCLSYSFLLIGLGLLFYALGILFLYYSFAE